MQPREAGIDIHEHAIWLGRFRAFGFLHPGTQIGQALRDRFAIAHVPAAVEGREHQRAIIGIHLFRTHGEAAIAVAGLEKIDRQLETSRAAGAGVLDIHHWNALNADLAQRYLSADHVLALHVALHGVREKRAFDALCRESGIGKSAGDGLAGHVLDGLVPKLSERRHADADDIYVLHHSSSCISIRETEACASH